MKVTLKAFLFTLLLTACWPSTSLGPVPTSHLAVTPSAIATFPIELMTRPTETVDTIGEVVLENTLEASMAITTTTFPTFLERTFDQQQCPSYCWYDLMIGQNEDEAFAAVSQIPVIDKEFKWHDGGEEVYIHVEQSQVEPGVTFIEWHEKGSYGWWDNNTAILQDNVVDTLLIQLPESFPLQFVLNRFGEPSLIRPVDIIDSNFFVKLVYPEAGVIFYVAVESRKNSNEMYLTGISSVVAVALKTPEITMAEYCVKDYYMRWAGFGKVTKYTFPQAEELIINEVPDWCEQ